MDIVFQVEGFEWDEWNITKNWEKHRVSHFECEEIFLNEPLIIRKDEKHSQMETRYFVSGKTNNNRLLSLAFTIRNNKIRVIMARDMTRKESQTYAKVERNTKV